MLPNRVDSNPKKMRSYWSLKGRRQIRTQFWPWYSRHVCRKFSGTGKRVDVLNENFGYFLRSRKTKSNSLICKQLAHIFWYHETFNKQRLDTMSTTVLTALFLRLLAMVVMSVVMSVPTMSVRLRRRPQPQLISLTTAISTVMMAAALTVSEVIMMML